MIANIEKYTDSEVIELVLNGDENIFSELVRRYKNLIYSIILRMVNDKEEANDLAQEVFIKIYTNLAKYSNEFKFSTWIIRITTNHVIDFRRKKHYETVNIDDIDFELGTDQSPEELFLLEEERLFLNNIVNDLPEMYKIPIVLYHHEGRTYQEIAEIIQVPLSKVKNRIFRGRKLLKDTLLSLVGR